MTPQAIRELREALRCTAAELAETLGVEADTVRAWERAELFPTKRWVEAMERLTAAGPAAVKRRRKRARDAKPVPTGLPALAQPEIWEIVRKLAAHPEFRERVKELASTYDDPATD